MPFWGNRPEEEERWIRESNNARARAQAAAAAWSEADAAYARNIASMAPWMRPGIALALAKSHASPKAIEAAARGEATRFSQIPNAERGSRVRPEQLLPGHRRLLEKGPLTGMEPQPQTERDQFGRVMAGTRQDFARASQRAGVNRPTTQATAEWQQGQAMRQQLQQEGVLDDKGQLLAPVAGFSNFLDEDKQLDEEKVARLDPGVQRRLRRFVELLDAVDTDTYFVDADGELNIWDPETRSARLDPSSIDKVNPFEPITNVFTQPRLPQLRDIPGLAGTEMAQSQRPITEDVGEFMESRRLPNLTDVPVLGETQGVQRASAVGVPSMGSLTDVVQGVGMAMNASVQEFQGMIRNAYGQATGRDVDWWEPQSDLLIMESTNMEPGDGLLVDPDSEVAQERLRREAERGLLNGERVTLGRLYAAGLEGLGVIEAGDTPYRVLSGIVDTGVQIADPFAVMAGAFGRGLQARTIFQAAREAAEASAKRDPLETMADIRAIASSFGVAGRGAMSRENLVTTLASRADEVLDMPRPQVFNLAARFNVQGRTRMSADELRTIVRDRLGNIGKPPPPPASVPGEAIEATGVGRVLAESVVEGATAPFRFAARTTGIPWLARKTGLIKGDFTSGIHGPTADGWLNGAEGTWKRERIAETKSIIEMDAHTGHKLLPGELEALVNTDTADEVSDVLRPLLSTRIRSTKDVWNEWAGRPADLPIVGQAVRGRNAVVQKMDKTPWDQNVPGSEIDLDDPRSAFTNVVAWMRNAHMDDAKIEPYARRVATATNNNEIFDIVEDVMLDTNGVLAQAGVGPQLRRELTRAYRREVADAQTWFLNEMTEQKGLFDEIDVGGTPLATGRPHDWASAYNRYIYLPDYREVRRITSSFPQIAWNEKGELRAVPELVRWFQEEMWKPITLLRGAWPVRVIGEEQLRMAAAGWTSMFKDPLSFIATAIARRNDVVGDPYVMAREFEEASVRRTAGWLTDRPGRVRTGRPVIYEKGDEGWDKAVANILTELHLDPVTRKIAESDSLDEVEEWMTNGAGRQWLDKAILDHPERFPDALPSGGVRQYIENAAAWVENATGGNEDLLRVIRDGKIPSKHAVKNRRVMWDAVGGDRMPTRRLVELVNDRAFDASPNAVAGTTEMAFTGPRRQTVERLFTWLMAKPTNYLSRHPVFTQAYWSRLAEMAGNASPTAYDELVTGAQATTERLGMLKITEAPTDVIKKIKRTEPVGNLDLEQLDLLAKGYALDETRKLLYDMAERSQFMDSLRLVFPFGEAWREVITRWAGDLANPLTPRGWNSLRRFQQSVQGARGQDFGEVMGAPEGKGFFFQDEYGEEVFIYPGSQWFSETMTDALGEPAPIALAGPVEGLSMFGTVIPGIGPAASIPVAALIQDEPGWQRSARNWLLPYGHPSERGGGSLTQLMNYAPTWMKSAVQALTSGGYDQESNRIYANSILSAANYHYSTGRYDTSTAAGRHRLFEDARQSARVLTAVRAMAAFGAPSAPQMKFLTETDEGTLLTAFLRDDYYKLVDEEGYERADEIFLDRWGDTAAMVMQAQTREVQPGIEPTQEFGDWVRSAEGKHMKERYDAIWAFFGPGGGKFDPETYRTQIRSGEREALGLNEWLALGQNHLGQMLSDRLMAGYPENPTEEDRDWRAEMEYRISQAYPGFNDFSNLTERPDAEKIRRQIDEALQDKVVLNTPIGEALAEYWRARNSVLEGAREMGLKARDVTYDLRRPNSLAEDRDWLFGIGERLARAYPGFDRIWNRQLRHEVEPDVED